MSASDADVTFRLDGRDISARSGGTLLDALREQLGVRSVKDGCSPQGQCGCCTVWVDGQPRVACVTPVARVRGRDVTTVDGVPDAAGWAARFCDTGASQCGFCTPGIIVRAAALDPARRADPESVRRMLLAHLCRCTGWQPVVDAIVAGPADPPADAPAQGSGRDRAAAERRAELEGGVAQSVAPEVALGRGGFADDRAPADALVALLGADGSWVVGESLADARAASRKVQGRRTTMAPSWPIEPPPGDWVRTLQTTWVEPAYLEPDASWCEPCGDPVSAHGNGGAFGGKQDGEVEALARQLADEHGRAVRVLRTREDVVRFGSKRPPLALGVAADGAGWVRVARTAGISEAIVAVAPDWQVEEVDVAGPPTSASLRGAGWAEVAVAIASLQTGPDRSVRAPNGAVATARVDADAVTVRVRCGVALDHAVLRSYCVGAAHMALGWVTSEALAVDATGEPHDLTIRSFGVLRAVDTPSIHVEIEDSDDPPVNGSDAVFAAVAAAAWSTVGWAPRWPAGGSSAD